MDIFQYRDRIIDDYRAFTRSFTQIKATDIQQFVAGHHDSGHYWPAPHIQLNPAFVYTKTVEELAAEGTLHPACAEIFRFGRKPASIGDSARLFHHQYEAIKAAQRQASYVLTTGTGSGKSLSYIIPIVDHVLRTKRNDAPSIKAIIIYPMNALVNSQLEELDKFFGHYGEQPPVTYGRYTGQESQEERQAMAASPPDIILTNFMMLELLMTRQDELDRTVMKAAKGLNFLVLDELHTYRGRQGADVAMLVRRVREALNPSVQCVGTSATMASEGSRESCAKVVADVASKLFGAPVEPENIITERLERQTSAPGKPSQQILSEAIQAGLPDHLDFNALREHPVSSWIELTLGLVKEEGDWVRAKPCTLQQAAQKLADDAELDPETCELYLRDFLIIAYRCKDAEGKTLFAFRLHQFLSGANTLYSTLEPESKRQLDLSGQVFKPGSDKHQRFYSVHFCRQCGQEYYPVWRIEEGGETRLLPRDIDDRSTDEEDGVDFGFYIFDSKQGWNDEDPENYPENWLELKNGDYRIKQNFKKHKPLRTYVLADGRCSHDGEHGWFIPGSFRFCLSCGTAYAARGKDGIRLTGLSGEGRSSASTILTISALRHLLERESELANDAKKLLGFTDNRQDAALQAGHFNDFIQVLLLRSALLAAVSTADEGYLTDSIIAQRVFERLGFHVSGDDYLDNPDAKGPGRRRAEETMRSVLGYRLYFDLRRGWRYNNPNLEQLGLLEIDYEGLKDLCADEDEWRDLPFPALSQVAPNNRFTALKAVLDTMRRGLCIKSRYLETQHQEQIRNQSFQYLKEPWGFTEDEQLQEGCYLITGSKAKYSRYLNTLVTGSARSLLGTLLKRASTWGDDATLMGQIKEKDYPALIDSLLKALQSYGLIEPENLDKELVGYQLLGEFLQWRAAPEAEQNTPKPQQPYAVDNTYFRALYRSVAALLEAQNRTFFELEAREHTAQVEPEQRELRESRFRWQTKDQERYASEGQLRTLFCSPTMELGVDIASLNSVYLRNVPPTPANYAQRSGRAGRSGQPALVLTYCAARSPHDQYFFQDPVRMIHGQVSPPSLDLANEDLIASHLHAIWLNETRQALPRTVNGMLDMQQPDEMPLLDEYAIPMDDAKVLKRTAERGRNLLKMLQDDLQAAQGIWLNEGTTVAEASQQWLERKLRRAFNDFDRALERWRELYAATHNQLESAHAIISNPAAAERERKTADKRYGEAKTQLGLLLNETAGKNSDFSTYRYLASQGFIPGYNFPRLRLLAYMPARRGKVGRERFLARPRFLAISEFGPLSLIYHEGSEYRVHKVILSVRDDQNLEHPGLVTEEARLCPSCGYGHFRSQLEAELCVACGTPIADGLRIGNLYRVENVSTRRALRITSDEEERTRQGYDMQTTIQFAETEGYIRVINATANHEGEPLLNLQYAPAATVWRVNLGWRRRKEENIFGFNIDATTGLWSKDEQAPTDVNDDVSQEEKVIQRITPYVEDRRNVLILHVAVPLDENQLTTLQMALKRGIEEEYQIEEAELVAEPLPTRTTRHAILLYEAAEGGAGVLTRLVTDANALAKVANRALHIAHYETTDQWQTRIDTNPECEAGCYRCLLSYYNQPDHELIDRRDPGVVELLCRLTQARVQATPSGRSHQEQTARLQQLSNSSLEQAWLKTLDEQGYRLPDEAQLALEAFDTRPDYLYRDQQAVIYIDGPQHEIPVQQQKDSTLDQRLEEAGLTVIRFPKEQARWPALFAQYPEIFGRPKQEGDTDEHR